MPNSSTFDFYNELHLDALNLEEVMRWYRYELQCVEENLLEGDLEGANWMSDSAKARLPRLVEKLADFKYNWNMEYKFRKRLTPPKP